MDNFTHIKIKNILPAEKHPIMSRQMTNWRKHLQFISEAKAHLVLEKAIEIDEKVKQPNITLDMNHLQKRKS